MDVLNIKRLLLVAACMLSLSAVAEEKIAVIDVARAIFSTDIAKQRQEEMQSGSEFASLQAKYDNIGADMKALQKEVEGKAMTLSQEKAAEYKKKMEYLFT